MLPMQSNTINMLGDTCHPFQFCKEHVIQTCHIRHTWCQCCGSPQQPMNTHNYIYISNLSQSISRLGPQSKFCKEHVT